MNQKTKKAFQAEMRQAINLYEKHEFRLAFEHLENAHIMGQPYVIPHTYSHYWMFKIGIRQKDTKQVIGQIFRMLASIIFSRIWVPEGNTGGVDVNPFKPMPVPEKLKPFLK